MEVQLVHMPGLWQRPTKLEHVPHTVPGEKRWAREELFNLRLVQSKSSVNLKGTQQVHKLMITCQGMCHVSTVRDGHCKDKLKMLVVPLPALVFITSCPLHRLESLPLCLYLLPHIALRIMPLFCLTFYKTSI